MTHSFVFCHGWGFDDSFWKSLYPYFKDSICSFWKLGYFSEEDYPLHSQKNLIGIGHSIGMKKLTESPYDFKALIGLQGFTNFLGKDEKTQPLRKKQLKSMTLGFNRSPRETLKRFYSECGSFQPKKNAIENLQKERLSQDLNNLSSRVKNRLCPTLILASQDDSIVPPSIIHDNFSSNKNIRILFCDDAKHNLGFLKKDFVIREIMRFLDDIKKS